MKKALLLLTVSGLFYSAAFAQRIIYTSRTIQSPSQDAPIKALRFHWIYAPAITVKYIDGQTREVAKDSIWGYEDKLGHIYRYYKPYFYLVGDTDELISYSKPVPVGKGVSTAHYFSHDLDSPIRMTKAKALRDATPAIK